MLYTLLIYHAEQEYDQHSEETREAILAGHRRVHEATKKAGAFVLGNRLMPTGAATTIRHNGTGPAVLDGPFAETKEQLAGLYVLECADLDEAIAYAKTIHHADTSVIEIRPVAYYEGPGAAAG